ncbi:mitotic checkpoint regulator, MAD2B-interacting-domain-containing protein [Aspergillus coremiiformis]|uniref:Mitotic checkpoint regulator, MAD2B-interacting-domain-containing protein n=1 Tax=Aspergillus coremiiformis TaxID=138285 RepID=A0A5N6YVI8_9EURO|nr:mitotic checkpoint regulator, MAD2B-interacting-domain-containing protein [Aspergillus coremiiformis]
MALVTYTDSEASDSEPHSPISKPAKQAPNPKLVDSSNPRKIRVALPDLQPEKTEDGPARKKARVGGAGAFAGFNSLLPAPKKNVVPATTGRKGGLKTGAMPGFDRGALGEGFGDGERGGGEVGDGDGEVVQMEKPEEVKLKGNAMMFKPLSVGRGAQKKKKKGGSKLASAADVPQGEGSGHVVSAPAPVPQKDKVRLFSLGTGESAGPGVQSGAATYEPLVYTATDTDVIETAPELQREAQSEPAPAQTLDTIADDLNLSRSQRRHLFGRNADPSKSRILHFNTDKEYIANQELAHQTDLAALQHNPVRAIAPGKHSLQQLVNVANSQRDALEESFAAGRRNKKEAGSRYGW